MFLCKDANDNLDNKKQFIVQVILREIGGRLVIKNDN